MISGELVTSSAPECSHSAIKASQLLSELLSLSEKAAKIARAIRCEESLFSLLVEEKVGDEKNAKFTQDFKTLADVLVQETIKYWLNKKFPDFSSKVYGEETNEFADTEGKKIMLTITPSKDELYEKLDHLLHGKVSAVQRLVQLVYSEPDAGELINSDLEMDASDLAIWIDPIDGTAQYIKGDLTCVTVLIGVFSQSTKKPVMGVINQPFASQTEQGNYSGKTFYACVPASLISPLPEDRPCVTVASWSEVSQVEQLLSTSGSRTQGGQSEQVDEPGNTAGCLVRGVSGAGCKGLVVACGAAEAWVSFSPTPVYPWDICGPHALLLAQGGGVCDLQGHEFKYGKNESLGGGGGGLIAYCSNDVKEKILGKLAQFHR